MERAAGLSLLTRDKSFFSFVKEFLKSRGLGSSRGPLAVQKNLVLGLKKNNYNFNIDPSAKDLLENICVLRSPNAIKWLLENGVSQQDVIIGPNFSAEEVRQINNSYSQVRYFLAASPEVKETYKVYGVAEEKIKVWPVGIDTKTFADFSSSPKPTDCLIYFKRRTAAELAEVKKLLEKFSQSCKILSYGSYSQSDLLKAAKECRYGIILNGTESQGIAVQSLMSCNLPLFVFDQVYLGDSENRELRETLRVTSVPYFSSACGVKVPTDTFGSSKIPVKKILESETEFTNFLKNISQFKPREFIVQNLSLEKQAKELTSLF